MLSRLAVAAVSVLALSSRTVNGWWQPKPGTSYQIQLNGELDLSYDVDMYDIDLFDTPNETIAELQARGVKVVCYFSAGTYEDWRSDAGLYTDAMIGEALPEWKGEYWIDTTSEALRAILVTRMELAQAKGCDGVDPDNVDGAFNDSGFNLTNATQLDFNRFLAEQAHALNLTVGLKNDLDQIEQLVTEFDFAVNEQCVENDECDVLVPFVEHDKPVFGIEYDGDKAKGCATANALDFDTLYMDMNLDGSRYSCREEDGSSSESVASGSTDSSSSGDSSSTGSNLSSERPLLSTLSLLLVASVAVAVAL